MGLNRYKLGELVELYNEKCNIKNLDIYQVSGINRNKEFFEPSKSVGNDTSNYKIVLPNYFACNLMHVGRDVVLPISMNTTEQNKYVSPAYSVFKICNEEKVLKEYFFMMLKSNEKDRLCWFNTDSSVRDGLDWNDFCKLEVLLPSIEIQQKYVNIYKSMQENQKAYERGLEDLKLVCEAYIEDLRRKMPCEEIGKYITECNEKNEQLIAEKEMGVNINKSFFPTRANASDKTKQKVVYPNMFAFNTNTSRNSDTISIALNNSSEAYAVSNTYCVFKLKNTILPEYLMLWFCKSEFDRYARFHSWGSARETFTWSDLNEVKIPIPDMSVQSSIVNIYKAYNERKNINEQLKQKLKDICPILIKGSLEEAKREMEVV